MLIEDLSQIPEFLIDGYRGILLIRRNKDGEPGNAQRRAFKQISSNADHWRKIIAQFQHLQQTSHPDYRIYSSVNPRNMSKAIHEFKRRQLEFDYGNNAELDEFYRDIENRFFSCLMNPGCKERSFFLIDCDSKQEYQDALNKIPEEHVVFDYATKNGRHLITTPFNPNEINVPIKKDDLLAIA